MAYRINKRKRLVEVTGEADLDSVIAKVKRHGGAGWRVKTLVPDNLVQQVVERVEANKKDHAPRPIGFRAISGDDDHGLVTGLPFTPPMVDDE